MPGFGAAFGGLLGNQMLQSIVLYQIVGSLIGAGLSPYLQALTNRMNEVSPLVPLPPTTAAELAMRGTWGEGVARREARMSGIDDNRMGALLSLAGAGPSPAELAAALRRKLIDGGKYQQGLEHSGIRPEWRGIIEPLSRAVPSPEAILQAYLQGQVEEGRARELYQQLGGDVAYFQLMYDTQGTAPTPTQALDLANRGIIPWDGEGAGVVSFRQAFLEGPWRNKWEGPFRALGEYLPPPRTVTAMYREGSIDRATAAELLAKQGLAPRMVEAYLYSGSSQRTTATKDLAQSTILELYRDRLISAKDAMGALQSLGYDQSEADLVLQVADAQLAQRYLSLAVGRVRSRYTGWKITREQARKVLADLQVPADGVSDLLAIWDIERSTNTATLTAAQIAGAYKDGLIDQGDATARLQQLGYTPDDAWLYLSNAAGEALPDRPR